MENRNHEALLTIAAASFAGAALWAAAAAIFGSVASLMGWLLGGLCAAAPLIIIAGGIGVAAWHTGYKR